MTGPGPTSGDTPDPTVKVEDEGENTVTIVTVDAGDDLARVRTLMVEYADLFDGTFRLDDFDAELAALPAPYVAPRGILLLATVNQMAAGCVGVAPRNKATAEMRRLFVRPDYRGHALGRRLSEAALDAARRARYRKVVTETTPATQAVAESVYRDLGFTRIAYDGPAARSDVVAYECRL